MDYMQAYMQQQVYQLKEKSNAELLRLIDYFSEFLENREHATFANYLAHVKREYAERVGRK